jgi:hypothetical protein
MVAYIVRMPPFFKAFSLGAPVDAANWRTSDAAFPRQLQKIR